MLIMRLFTVPNRIFSPLDVCFDQIGDLFNFLSAIFFGIHTLRTEHISRTTRKENLFGLLGYEVFFLTSMLHLLKLARSAV